MSIAIDIFIIALVIFFMVWFTRYGFARTVFKIGKTWLSLFTSIAIGPFISGRIESWFLSGTITNGIKQTLVSIVETNPNEYNISMLFDNLPSSFISFLGHYNISLPELEATYGSYTEASDEILQAIAERIAAPCASLVSSILGHIICFLITFFFFKWLNFKIRTTRLAFFRYVDHISGFITGTVIGVCVAVAFSMVLLTVFQIIVAYDAHSPVMDIYENSYVFKFINQMDLWGMLQQFLTRAA